MTAVQIAAEIGVSERTVRRAIAAGRLPFVKLHSRRYDIDLNVARTVIRGSYRAALADALEVLREVGYEADAREIEERHNIGAAA